MSASSAAFSPDPPMTKKARFTWRECIRKTIEILEKPARIQLSLRYILQEDIRITCGCFYRTDHSFDRLPNISSVLPLNPIVLSEMSSSCSESAFAGSTFSPCKLPAITAHSDVHCPRFAPSPSALSPVARRIMAMESLDGNDHSHLCKLPSLDSFHRSSNMRRSLRPLSPTDSISSFSSQDLLKKALQHDFLPRSDSACCSEDKSAATTISHHSSSFCLPPLIASKTLERGISDLSIDSSLIDLSCSSHCADDSGHVDDME